MNIVKDDKLVLVKDMDGLKVGETYKVTNITDTYAVISDDYYGDVACTVDIADLYTYFAKKDEASGWTKWTRMINPVGDTIAEYRTNFKHVEVRILNNMLDYPNGKVIRSTAMCSQGDDFDLAFGIHLAYLRCEQKYLRNEIEEYDSIIEDAQEYKDMCKSRMANNKSVMKRMLESID